MQNILVVKMENIHQGNFDVFFLFRYAFMYSMQQEDFSYVESYINK